MRGLVVLAIIISIAAIIYYYHPEQNVIDYFNLKPGTASTTGNNQNQPQPSHGVPFQDMMLDQDGKSVMQNPDPANPPPPPGPRPNPPQNNPVRVNQLPPPQPPPVVRPAKSSKDKIIQYAKDNECEMLAYQENPIGQVVLTVRAKDKNRVFDFIDALEKGVGLRDVENVPGGYKVVVDADGRTIITSTMKIRYAPEY